MKTWVDEMDAKIPRGGVRTRVAPSPTGFMHIGGLRTALYAYLTAKKSGGTFILRIEDTDTARFVEGSVEIIIETLKGAGLEYDEGPDVGGPAAPYTQSERRGIYHQYARLLCEKGAAYYCFCEHVNPADQKPGDALGEEDPCRELPCEDSGRRADGGEAFVVRMKAPREGATTVVDMVFGEVTTPNKTLDDMVLLKRDGMPTYNFANVVDDHLMGITHVVRGSEYISSAPKYNLLYQAFGWELPIYITVSNIMRDANHKLSKRHGDPTYDDLLKQGYLPEAVLNYVALLGWSPGGEREMFTLKEMLEVFDVGGISKSPAIYDVEKLNYFNSEYIRALPPSVFAEMAQPYIRRAVRNEDISAEEIAHLLQARCEKFSDIPEKIDFFDSLPEYDTGLYVHKKSKTDEIVSLEMLRAARAALEGVSDWTMTTIHDTLMALAEKLGVRNATLMWPVRVAVSGKPVTPGGAVEICRILGRVETIRRIDAGIGMLKGVEGIADK